MEVTKDTMIGDLLREDFGCAAILMGSGMHCVGCPASQMETIEEACAVHGFEPSAVVRAINRKIAEERG
jgi:hybrid cluster-associated redox disulfide protein